MLLKQADIDTFAADGVVCLRGVIPPEWIERVTKGIEKNLLEPGVHHSYADGETRRFFQDANNWQRISEFESFVRSSPAREIAGHLLRASQICFLHDHVLVKHGGASKATPWHQDQPYSPVDGWQFCTMWMPIDPVARDTALECVAGSHAARKWYRPQRFVDGALRAEDDPRWSVLPDINADRSAYRIVSWDMEPGDIVVFHGLTLHGAPANHGAQPRRVLSTRWLGDDARVQRRSGKMSPPLPDDAPADGEPFESSHFPLVWKRAAPL